MIRFLTSRTLFWSEVIIIHLSSIQHHNLMYRETLHNINGEDMVLIFFAFDMDLVLYNRGVAVAIPMSYTSLIS